MDWLRYICIINCQVQMIVDECKVSFGIRRKAVVAGFRKVRILLLQQVILGLLLID